VETVAEVSGERDLEAVSEAISEGMEEGLNENQAEETTATSTTSSAAPNITKAVTPPDLIVDGKPVNATVWEEIVETVADVTGETDLEAVSEAVAEGIEEGLGRTQSDPGKLGNSSDNAVTRENTSLAGLSSRGDQGFDWTLALGSGMY